MHILAQMMTDSGRHKEEKGLQYEGSDSFNPQVGQNRQGHSIIRLVSADVDPHGKARRNQGETPERRSQSMGFGFDSPVSGTGLKNEKTKEKGRGSSPRHNARCA